jgi:hypothetical protein
VNGLNKPLFQTLKKKKNVLSCWALVAHTYLNRDQEDRCWRPARANSLGYPLLQKPIIKKWLSGVAQVIDEFKPGAGKKKEKEGGGLCPLLMFKGV